MKVIPMLALLACQSSAPESTKPTKVERTRDANPADAKLVDATDAIEPHEATLASWSSKPAGTSSPACISGGNDRFIQYADVDDPGAVRFCLWWNLAKEGMPDAGCWRVDLATGEYAGQGGVWFATRQPPRVGFGGGGESGRSNANARWRDDGLEVCRGTACKHVALPRPKNEHEMAFDASGELAVVPLDATAKGREVATIEVATGTQVATFTIANHHEGAEVVGFLGSALAVTDCDTAVTTCTWDLYDPRTGKRIAAVGGASPLGAGGTAAAIDAQRFAAVAGAHLVVQSTTGAVTASLQLPRPPKIGSEYVAFVVGATVAMLGPDGRIVLVDPGAGKTTRTIMPPPCKR